MQENAYLNLEETLRRFPLETLAKIIHSKHPEVYKTLFETCPECLNGVEVHDGERVCTSCGVVLENVQRFEHHLPHTFTVKGKKKHLTLQPSNFLAFGKGLGNTDLVNPQLGRWKHAPLYRVLAKAPAGKKDLPLRCKFIRIMTNKIEHPIVLRVKEAASRTSKRSGFYRENDEASAKFADWMGRLAQKTGAYIALTADGRGCHQTGKAVFVKAVERFFGIQKAEELREKLKVKEEELAFVEFVWKGVPDFPRRSTK